MRLVMPQESTLVMQHAKRHTQDSAAHATMEHCNGQQPPVEQAKPSRLRALALARATRCSRLRHLRNLHYLGSAALGLILVCVCVCVCVCVSVCVCVIGIYTYLHIPTYIHTNQYILHATQR